MSDVNLIAITGSNVVLLDSNIHVLQTLFNDNINCNYNSAKITPSFICISQQNKAKLVFITQSQNYRASVPEIVTAIDFSTHNNILFAGTKTGKLFIWEIEGVEEVSNYFLPPPTTTLMISGNCKLNGGSLLMSHQLFYTEVTDINVSGDNTKLLLSSSSGDLALINLTKLFFDRFNQKNYVGHSATILSAVQLRCELEDRISFVSVSKDKNLRLWNYGQLNSIESIFLEHNPLSLVLSICQNKCYIPCDDGTVIVLILNKLKQPLYLKGHILSETPMDGEADSQPTSFHLQTIHYSPVYGGPVFGCVEGRYLVTCAMDGLRVWDVNTRICLSQHQNISNVCKLLPYIKPFPNNQTFVPLKNSPPNSEQLILKLTLDNQ